MTTKIEQLANALEAMGCTHPMAHARLTFEILDSLETERKMKVWNLPKVTVIIDAGTVLIQFPKLCVYMSVPPKGQRLPTGPSPVKRVRGL